MFTPTELEQIPDVDRIFIYGAGVTGTTMFGLLAARGHLIAGYFDTFNTGELNYLPIRSPDEITSRVGPNDLIVIASAWYLEVEEILKKKGVINYLNGTLLAVTHGNEEMITIRRFINNFVRPGGVTFDVGANIGAISIYLARRAKHVYAFEPNLELFDRFASITECYGNISLIPKAVGDRIGKNRLNLSSADLNATASSFHIATDRSIEVECIRLDDWVREAGIAPSFIKVDAEFNDVQVIRGAVQILSEHRPVFLFEAAGTENEIHLMEELSGSYRFVRIPFVSDPFWTREYVDALEFYRKHGAGRTVNIGGIPR
jgi:FkbM family methyltransferase